MSCAVPIARSKQAAPNQPTPGVFVGTSLPGKATAVQSSAPHAHRRAVHDGPGAPQPIPWVQAQEAPPVHDRSDARQQTDQRRRGRRHPVMQMVEARPRHPPRYEGDERDDDPNHHEGAPQQVHAATIT